jgi:hypothetical protein
MALPKGKQAAKTGLAKEYEIIFLTENVTSENITYPVFIKITKANLALLGGAKKLGTVPSEEYTTPSGLKHKYLKTNGLVWRNVTGTTKLGAKFESTEVAVPTRGTEVLKITVNKVRPLSIKGRAISSRNRFQNNRISARPTSEYKTISIRIPKTVNASQVAEFILSNFGNKGDLVQGWSIGTIKEWYGKKLPASVKNVEPPVYLPMGVNVDARKLVDGSVGGGANNVSNTVVYAVANRDVAQKLGLTTVEESTQAALKSGTTFGTTNTQSEIRSITWKVFKKPQAFNQVWTSASVKGVATKTPIAVSGVNITVKCRYAKRLNTAAAAGGTARTGRIKTTVETVQFKCPAGTPKGMIAEFLMQVPRRPRSFAIAIGGSSKFGTSVPLPQKSGATAK